MASRRLRAAGSVRKAGAAAAFGLGLGKPRFSSGGGTGVSQLQKFNQRKGLTYAVAGVAATYAGRSAYRKGKAEYQRRKKRRGAYRRRRDSEGKFR